VRESAIENPKGSDTNHSLAERRESLAPWVGADMRLVSADRWLDGEASFKLGREERNGLLNPAII